MRFSPSFLDELRSRLRVSEIVGRRVKLKRSGNGELIGLCPFHTEKSPSFSVSDRKGFYHCFGCAKHGNVIDFIMETEGRSFAEAVTDLASQAGMALPKEDKAEEERYKKRATLYDVTEAACAWFEQQLQSQAGRMGREYFAGRGITEATIRHFRLGYALDSRDALKKAMLAQGIGERQLVDAGLLVDKGAVVSSQWSEEKENPAPTTDHRPPTTSYDRFRCRVIFPITDERGKVIAFGGRILGDEKPKYLNSPETELFHKGHVLYAFHFARERAHKKNAIVAVEGYMDVIALHQAGITNAVAPLGTALTEHQLALLWRVAHEPVLCLDGDAAGQRAMERAANLALPHLEPSLSLKFAVLPKGEDPDDYLRRHGVGALRMLLASAAPLADTLWEMTLSSHPLATPEQKAAFEAALMEHVAAIKNASVQHYYRQHYKQKLWDMRSARGKSAKPEVVNPALKGAAARLSTAPRERYETHLIAALLHHPDLLHDPAVEENFAHLEFSMASLSALRHAILEECGGNPEISSHNLLEALENHSVAPHIRSIRSDPFLDSFTRPETPPDRVRNGWDYMLASYHLLLMEEEYRTATESFSEASAAQANALREQVESQKKLVEKEKIAYDAALGD